MSAIAQIVLTQSTSLALVVLLLQPVRNLGAQGPQCAEPQSFLYPPQCVVEGRSIADWLLEKRRWEVEIPDREINRILTCSGGPFSEVFFLSGPRVGGRNPPDNCGNPARATCSVPAGVPVLVDLVSLLTWRSDACFDCASCRQAVASEFDVVNGFELALCREGERDCEEIADQVGVHRQSPLACFDFVVPDPNRFGLPPGARTDGAVDGYAVMLRPLEPGRYELRQRAFGGPVCLERTYTLEVEGNVSFRRGDCNDDGEVNISDPVCILNWQFAGGTVPGCVAATNTNGDDDANISDAIYLLHHLFAKGPAPAAPVPECGPGVLPADAALGCANPSNC